LGIFEHWGGPDHRVTHLRGEKEERPGRRGENEEGGRRREGKSFTNLNTVFLLWLPLTHKSTSCTQRRLAMVCFPIKNNHTFPKSQAKSQDSSGSHRF